MRLGTIELILLAVGFLILQFWWVSMTIKNGRTGEVDKWGQKIIDEKDKGLEKQKKDLEKIFRA